MGKSTQKTKPSQTANPAMDAALAAFNPALATAWFDVMTESARFVTDRLQQDMETQRALLRCTSPTELMQVQTDFYQRAIAQYTAEATKLIEIMQGGVATHKRSYDDVPL